MGMDYSFAVKRSDPEDETAGENHEEQTPDVLP
jgi:hypothetical protein